MDAANKNRSGGSNTTIGLFGTFGLEFSVSDKFSTCIESGGGFKQEEGKTGLLDEY